MVSLGLLVYVLRKDPRSIEILRYVMNNTATSIREISTGLGYPYSATYYKVKKLERIGVIRIEKAPQHIDIVTINPRYRKTVETALKELTKTTTTTRKRK